MWPVLGLHSSNHLGVVANDINLTIEDVQALDRMPYPWSKTQFRDFPQVNTFWRIEHIVDIPQKTYFWVMTRIFDATFVVNTYQLLGMILVGVVTYLLCRQLEVSKYLAIGAGLASQSLPAIRQMMLTGVAANQNVIFPLLMIAVLVRNSQLACTQTRVLRVISVLAGAFVTSAYMFNYAFVILALFLLKNFSSVFRRLRASLARAPLSAISVGCAFVALVILLAELLRRRTSNEYGRPYGIYSLEDIFKDVYTLRGFVSPDKFHLLFPGTYWEPEGYSQQYGGVIFVALALSAVLLIFNSRLKDRISFVILITLVMTILSLGRFHIGDFEILAARELFRFIMLGNRRYAIAGMITQALVVVLAAYFLNWFAQLIRNRKVAVFLIVIVWIVGLLDINPGSRRFVYAYADQYADIRAALHSLPDSAVYISPSTESQKNFYVFDYPIYERHTEAFASASIGAQPLADLLTARGVGFLLALVNDRGESYIAGYIQNSVRFSTILPSTRFIPAAPDLTLRNISDEGLVEREWTVRLVQIRAASEVPSSGLLKLAQYVSQPVLEVAQPDIDRRKIKFEWATAPEIVFRTEALPSEIMYTDQPEIEFMVTIVPPPGTFSPFKVKIESSLETVWLVLEKDPVTVQVRSKLYEQIIFKTDSSCNLGSDPSLGVLIGRPICYGISNFAVLQSNN